MICEKCGSKKIQLFYSYACDFCDQPKQICSNRKFYSVFNGRPEDYTSLRGRDYITTSIEEFLSKWPRGFSDWQAKEVLVSPSLLNKIENNEYKWKIFKAYINLEDFEKNKNCDCFVFVGNIVPDPWKKS